MKRMREMSLVASMLLLTLQGCGGGGTATTQTQDVQSTTTADKETIQTSGTKATEPTPQTKDSKKLFVIKSKTTYKVDENITTTYAYHDKYLSGVHESSTTGVSIDTTYQYFQNHQVMKSYDERGYVKSVAVFAPRTNPNSDYIFDRRLSQDTNARYLLSTFDALAYHDGLQVRKQIDATTTGTRFTYDAKDLLSKIESGNYGETNPEAIDALQDDANTSYLLEEGSLDFTPAQETEYLYSATGVLDGVAFHAPAGDLNADISVSFYADGKLEDLNISTGDSFHYNQEGYLESKSNTRHGTQTTYNYTYTNDGKTVTVKDANGKLVKAYRFEMKKVGE